MRFDEGWRLVFLVAPIALLVAYVVAQFARRKYAVRFTSVDLLASVAPRRPGWQRHVSAVLMLLALVALVVGFAEPARSEKVPKERGTILLAIDTSGSMDAKDVAPTRLAAAQAAARQFVDRLPPGPQVGLLSYDTAVMLRVAPTTDRNAVIQGLSNLRLGGGTATGEAIFRSLDALADVPPADDGTKAGGTIVIMSDGAPTVGRGAQEPLTTVDQATAAAKKAGVPVNTIAFGTDQGTVERDGETIPVPADPDTMERIAKGSGGKSFTAESSDQLNSVYEQIRLSVGYDTVWRDISVWFIALALAFAVATGAAAIYWMQRLP